MISLAEWRRFSIVNSLLMFFLLYSCGAAELSEFLRKAAELYRNGKLDEARTEALIVHKYFPDDLEALLLLGRIDFEAKRYIDSKQWFRLASVKNPKHPLVKQYRKLIEELEYRNNGPFNIEPLPLPLPDRDETAQRFKKAWFGPNFIISSTNCKPPAADPVLSREPLPNQFEILDFLDESDAAKAMQNGMYFKAYVIYSRILSHWPQLVSARLGLAEAAMRMGRYSEAVSVLTPLFTDENALPTQRLKARELAESAALALR